MKISVVTVALNAADTISRSIESVATQTHNDVEHILIDGCSKDGTIELLEKYRGHLSHVVSETDNGIYHAMNKGLELASGEIVCFLNADDFYSDSRVLERVALEMRGNTIDALFGDVVYFRAGSPERVVRRYSSRNFSPELIPYGWMPAHPSLFVRRRIYQNLGGFRTQFKIAGDFDFVARAFGLTKIRYKYFPFVLVCMQLGGVSTSGFRSKLLLNKEVLLACRDNGFQTNMLRILSKYPLKVLEFFQK
jgi:glycosyltransferase involved in cell wall biosynthesis